MVAIREVTGTFPRFRDSRRNADYEDGRWFYVEAYVSNFGHYGPAAIGTVNERSGGANMLDLFVTDCLRGEGIGTDVILAAGERWPNLRWIGTDTSHGFHKALAGYGIAVLDGAGLSAGYKLNRDPNLSGGRAARHGTIKCNAIPSDGLSAVLPRRICGKSRDGKHMGSET
jgi:GNAT superfamily N-acetyltransferase